MNKKLLLMAMVFSMAHVIHMQASEKNDDTQPTDTIAALKARNDKLEGKVKQLESEKHETEHSIKVLGLQIKHLEIALEAKGALVDQLTEKLDRERAKTNNLQKEMDTLMLGSDDSDDFLTTHPPITRD